MSEIRDLNMSLKMRRHNIHDVRKAGLSAISVRFPGEQVLCEQFPYVIFFPLNRLLRCRYYITL